MAIVLKNQVKIDGVLEIGKKDYYVVEKESLDELLELIEDLHDVKIAKSRIGSPSITLEELGRTIGVYSKSK